MWVGKAVAEVLGVDPVDDMIAVKAAIKKLKKNRALKETIGRDGRRHDKTFIVAGDWVAPGFGSNGAGAGSEVGETPEEHEFAPG